MKGDIHGDINVLGIKLTKDESSIKILYEKNGVRYIRSGVDGFKKGTVTRSPLKSLTTKWGFKEVQGVPPLRDYMDIQRILPKFELTEDGRVVYNE